MNADRREEKLTERKSTELIARICAIWQSVTGFRSSEGSTVDSLTTEILNKFFIYLTAKNGLKSLTVNKVLNSVAVLETRRLTPTNWNLV